MKGEIHHCTQGTTEWFDLHRGVPSASQFGKIVTATGKKCAQWNSYLDKCVDGIVNGMNYAELETDWMLYGTQHESSAKALYEFEAGAEIHDVGFITNNGVGCSPDALIEEYNYKGAHYSCESSFLSGGLEIKCPKPNTHIGYLRENRLPLAYFPQVQGSLWITGLPWWDFLSYPATDSMKPFLIRVEPDEEYHKALDHYIPIFLQEMNELAEKVRI